MTLDKCPEWHCFNQVAGLKQHNSHKSCSSLVHEIGPAERIGQTGQVDVFSLPSPNGSLPPNPVQFSIELRLRSLCIYRYGIAHCSAWQTSSNC